MSDATVLNTHPLSPADLARVDIVLVQQTMQRCERHRHSVFVFRTESHVHLYDRVFKSPPQTVMLTGRRCAACRVITRPVHLAEPDGVLPTRDAIVDF